MNIGINRNGDIFINLIGALKETTLLYSVHVTIDVHHVAWQRTLYCSFLFFTLLSFLFLLLLLFLRSSSLFKTRFLFSSLFFSSFYCSVLELGVIEKIRKLIFSSSFTRDVIHRNRKKRHQSSSLLTCKRSEKKSDE